MRKHLRTELRSDKMLLGITVMFDTLVGFRRGEGGW